jgi:uncharacterized protein YbcV (DUF1398 family)
MNAQQRSIAQYCLTAAYDGSKHFPDLVAMLIEAGFEGYLVDYRKSATTYYLPDGSHLELPNAQTAGSVAAEFQPKVIQANVQEARDNPPSYSYKGFCANVKAAGCAGYHVSFLGKRVTYYGRTGETHVEHLPI